MNRYGKRCVLYPRVSTEMQVDGYSLEGQKNMLTRFADREEMIIVDTYEDAGKSGKSIEGRPAFQKMLRDIEDGLDIDYILVYKLSRFGRNAADILNSLELVQSYGVNLICIEEGIDSSQTSGKLLISVLSAVAEIERENIIEQTMNGRREKARQGGWNGGFAPYGYTLEDNKLMIEETEAVAIRKIFELYTSSEIGLGGIANQLNLQGIRKIPRQNGTLEDWTGHFIKLILDNPVYCGKIAYGRRTKEKVKGTKNDYQMKRNDDYILTEGQHKGIVSEEVWEKAHAKRLRTGVKQPSKIGRDRVHLLSGLLKCPVCGSPMYTNKHAWTNKDGTYKEIYYYVCSRNRMVRGKHCEYKAMLKKTDIEPMVIEAIREIVRNEEYAQAIKKRIGVQIDTKAVDKELEGYHIKAGKEMFAAEGAFGQFLLCFRNFPVTIGITAGTTAERIPDICLAYIKEAFQQRSAAPELRAEHSRNLKKKTADLSLAFPKGEHAQWEVDNWMLMNQKFSFSENPRGIQEALFLQENDNLEIWLKIDGEEKQLTAGFRKWIRNDLYPGNFRHQYHCLAYAFDGSALRIKVALINTSYVETYTLRPTVAGDSATAIHPQLTCSWQPNVTYLPPAPDNTWHFTATRKPE